MKIEGDAVEIYTGPVDKVGGAGPEPEERPAQRTIETTVDVNTISLTDEEKSGKVSFKSLMHKQQQIGEKAGAIHANMTAGELADGLTTVCRLCHWWDREKLARSIARLNEEKTAQNLAKLNELRGMFLEGGLSGATEIDAVIQRDMGQCVAYSELFNDLILSHALARCPDRTPAGQPVPSCFKMRGSAARRDAAAVRDHILKTAANK